MGLKTRLGGALLLAALVGAFAFPVAPAHATVTGATAFHCTADLPEFPSQNGNSGTCDADGIDASVTFGAGAGIDDGSSSDADGSRDPYVIGGVGSFHADFNYQEQCSANGIPPLLGTADGTATVKGAKVVEVVAAPAPHVAVGDATLSTHFSWTRVGLVALIITDNTKLDFDFTAGGFSDDNDTATATTIDVAVAGFVPILGASNTCPTGGPLKAKVVGIDVNPA